MLLRSSKAQIAPARKPGQQLKSQASLPGSKCN